MCVQITLSLCEIGALCVQLGSTVHQVSRGGEEEAGFSDNTVETSKHVYCVLNSHWKCGERCTHAFGKKRNDTLVPNA